MAARLTTRVRDRADEPPKSPQHVPQRPRRPRPRPRSHRWHAGSSCTAASLLLWLPWAGSGLPSAAAAGHAPNGRSTRRALLLLLMAADSPPRAGSSLPRHRGDLCTPVGEGRGTQKPLQGPPGAGERPGAARPNRSAIALARAGGGRHARAAHHRVRVEEETTRESSFVG